MGLKEGFFGCVDFVRLFLCFYMEVFEIVVVVFYVFIFGTGFYRFWILGYER